MKKRYYDLKELALDPSERQVLRDQVTFVNFASLENVERFYSTMYGKPPSVDFMKAVYMTKAYSVGRVRAIEYDLALLEDWINEKEVKS